LGVVSTNPKMPNDDHIYHDPDHIPARKEEATLSLSIEAPRRSTLLFGG